MISLSNPIGGDEDTSLHAIPEEIQLEVMEVLENFPELADTKIIFRYRKKISKSYMQAQPAALSIFRRKDKRKYVVKISRVFRFEGKEIPVEKLPTDVLKGWLAHELGHVVDYKERSGTEMVKFGLSYVLSTPFLKRAERRADIFAIDHGMGEVILSSKKFVREKDFIQPEYKARLEELYMSPAEVLELLEDDSRQSIDQQ